MVGKQYTFSRNCTLNFGLFPGYDMLSDTLMMLGDGSNLQLQQPHNHEDKQPKPLQPLFHSAFQSRYYRRHTTLYYKIGFVLHDFTQV